MMNQVYGYCRVAMNNEQAIYQQCQIIGDYCQANGLMPSAYLCDNGISGLEFERSQLNKMLGILQDGDVVVVQDAARLSRNIHQYMIIVRQIYKSGATLMIINE